jgi:hypothetical protein
MTVKLAVTGNVMSCTLKSPLLATAKKETSAFILRLGQNIAVGLDNWLPLYTVLSILNVYKKE